ncbi:GtrA family protein [Marinobacter hydrocarbonoclasticus]|nr:GtrA family protein [Marinobacter nauticus]
MSRFARFALIGALGFVVDSLCFALLWQGMGWPLQLSRAIAFVAAASTTWLGNRVLTFADRPSQPRWLQWRKALASAVVAAIPNLGVFQLLLMLLGQQGISPYIALVGGVLAGMGVNYFASQIWVFAPANHPRP